MTEETLNKIARKIVIIIFLFLYSFFHFIDGLSENAMIVMVFAIIFTYITGEYWKNELDSEEEDKESKIRIKILLITKIFLTYLAITCLIFFNIEYLLKNISWISLTKSTIQIMVLIQFMIWGNWRNFCNDNLYPVIIPKD